jgi:hypothetical protein
MHSVAYLSLGKHINCVLLYINKAHTDKTLYSLLS